MFRNSRMIICKMSINYILLNLFNNFRNKMKIFNHIL